MTFKPSTKHFKTKTCRVCKKTKSINSFWPLAHNPLVHNHPSSSPNLDNKMDRCKRCYNAYIKIAEVYNPHPRRRSAKTS